MTKIKSRLERMEMEDSFGLDNQTVRARFGAKSLHQEHRFRTAAVFLTSALHYCVLLSLVRATAV